MNTNLIPQSKRHINIDALAKNIQALKARCSPDVSLMAVVKANAYGHGAVQVSKIALANGASFLAVARIHEAVELRKAGIDAPLLLFGDLLPCQVEWLALNDVRVTIGSLSDAKKISNQLSSIMEQKLNVITGKKLKVHIKIDTGMGRLGIVLPEIEAGSSGINNQIFTNFDKTVNSINFDKTVNSINFDKTVNSINFDKTVNSINFDKAVNSTNFDKAVDEIMEINSLDTLDVEGIYTHFANADLKDKHHSNQQIRLFNQLICAIKQRGFNPKICHAANSAAIIEIPEGHLNMVRAGIAMYGLFPSNEVNHNLIHLEPVMSVSSNIIHLKSVPAGFKVSYGSTYVTPFSTKIATVPIGYADGYSRLLSSKGEMLVKGVRCKIIGRVCMDYTMIDVGNIPDVEVGDQVVIMGIQGNEKISADEIASHINTINYEVVCSFDRRMPMVVK